MANLGRKQNEFPVDPESELPYEEHKSDDHSDFSLGLMLLGLMLLLGACFLFLLAFLGT